jgi:hypothetical protein
VGQEELQDERGRLQACHVPLHRDERGEALGEVEVSSAVAEDEVHELAHTSRGVKDCRDELVDELLEQQLKLTRLDLRDVAAKVRRFRDRTPAALQQRLEHVCLRDGHTSEHERLNEAEAIQVVIRVNGCHVLVRVATKVLA